MISKYQFMEANTSRRALGLKDKIPDISKTLDTVRFLKSRKEGDEDLESWFELNDTLFARAKVQRTDECYLWLGANVMLAYPLEEAEELLVAKLEAAKSGLENAEEDMDFVREQITVSDEPGYLLEKMTDHCGNRPSKSLLPEFTTGTLVKGERTRLRERPPSPAVEQIEEQEHHQIAIIHKRSTIKKQRWTHDLSRLPYKSCYPTQCFRPDQLVRLRASRGIRTSGKHSIVFLVEDTTNSRIASCTYTLHHRQKTQKSE